jgi:hypothetical protein
MINAGPMVYDIMTDLPPDQLYELGIKVFRLWMEWALGKPVFPIPTLRNPTGRYASSLKFQRQGVRRVAIIAEDSFAPEVGILETGHEEVDLKKKLVPGRTYPMHRGTSGAISVGRGARSRSIWASAMRAGFNGFATVPSKITAENAGSWIIPAMPAYSPGRILAELIANRYGTSR